MNKRMFKETVLPLAGWAFIGFGMFCMAMNAGPKVTIVEELVVTDSKGNHRIVLRVDPETDASILEFYSSEEKRIGYIIQTDGEFEVIKDSDLAEINARLEALQKEIDKALEDLEEEDDGGGN